MLKTYTIPLSNISINSLYDLWINNGFDDESNVDIHKDLLLGSEKNINCIKLYVFENQNFIESGEVDTEDIFLKHIGKKAEPKKVNVTKLKATQNQIPESFIPYQIKNFDVEVLDENVFDPLNVQIQIRKNVIAGLKEFSLMLPDLKTGAIEANNYKVVDNGSFEVDGTIYPCIIVERIRLQDDRTTRYFLAPELDYLIIKVEDQDQDGDTMLELKKLY